MVQGINIVTSPPGPLSLVKERGKINRKRGSAPLRHPDYRREEKAEGGWAGLERKSGGWEKT
jgi:hypothetical protein